MRQVKTTLNLLNTKTTIALLSTFPSCPCALIVQHSTLFRFYCSFYVFYLKTNLKISKSGCHCICQSANIIISNIEILIGNTISKLNFDFLIKTLILPVCSEPTAYTPCNARAPKYCILLKANAKVLCMSGFGNVSTRKPTVGFIRGLDNLFGSLLYWGKKLV